MTANGSPRERVRHALLDARRSGDRDLAAALRGVAAAFDNAEAVPDVARSPGALESVAIGVGSTEAERRHLTVDDERRLLAAEVDELRSAAAAYDEHGHPERAAAARRAADVVAGCA